MPEPVKIAVISHGLKAGGGVSVGINCLNAVLNLTFPVQIMALLPERVGYEAAIATHKVEQLHWFRSDAGKMARLLFDWYRLPVLLREFTPDIIFCLGNQGVRYAGCPQLIVVQDAHYFYGQAHYFRAPLIKRIQYFIQRRKLAADLALNPLVFCQTRIAVERLKAWYGFNGDVRTLPNAVSDLIDKDSDEYINLPGGEGKTRLLYLARYYPHKNHEILLDLFTAYREQLGDVRLYLTIDVSHGKGARRLLEAIEDNQLQDHIINLGPQPQNKLGDLYRSVDGLIMPTLLESFSGTYLEAMSFGCPVLTSDLDFARHVCGDAALYFDPLDIDSILNAISVLASDTERSQRLRQAGYDQLKKLRVSWQGNTSIIEDAVREVLQLEANA